MERKLEKALMKFPLVVSVVTVGRGAVENGLTISWASPVSFDPLEIMIAVDRRHYSVDFLKSTKNFVINVLGEGQQKLAAHFATETLVGDDKLAGLEVEEAPTGAAILAEALAWFDCEVVNTFETGDHLLFVGRVVDAGSKEEGKPLTTLAGMRYTKSHARRTYR